MAVAVKNTPETRAPSVLDKLAVASLAGAVYLIGMLWAVFGGLPLLWRQIGLSADSFLAVAGLGLAMLIAFCVLAVLGVRLFSGKPRPGLRAGIFTVLVLLLVLLGVCRWIAGFVEARVYNNDWFQGSEGQWGGIIAGVVCALVVWWVGRLLFRPSFENFLVRFEEQGWFAARTYKPGQGQRVRRGTILGILLLGGSGIWVLMNRGTLGGAESRWDVDVPFTGRLIVTDRGDATEAELLKNAGNQLRVRDAGNTELKDGTNVGRDRALEILKSMATEKLAGLDEVLTKLAAREKQLRDSLKSINQPAARTATEEAANLIKGWRERLEPFREQLRAFVDAKTDEEKQAAEGNLFLMQGEIDKVARQEQEAEKNRERIKATQRVPLTGELDRITKWAQTDRLPVLAPIIDRFRVRDINENLDPNVNRVVRNPEAFAELPEKERQEFKRGAVIKARVLDEAIEKVKTQMRDRGDSSERIGEVEKAMNDAAPVVRKVEGTPVYASIVLLPAVRFTLPILLLALTLWLAWRIVNLPTFADFLVATEAEMNKVSWTTRSRLYQDTVVVLVTMILLAVFLFLVDMGWHAILSWKPIGVLRQPPPTTQKTDEDLKW